jgi:hypothetical protein
MKRQDSSVRAESHLRFQSLNATGHGQYTSFRNQIQAAVFKDLDEAELVRLGALEDVPVTSASGGKFVRHPLAVCIGVHDRTAHAPNDAVIDFLWLNRDLRSHLRSSTGQAAAQRLPSIKNKNPAYLGVNWTELSDVPQHGTLAERLSAAVKAIDSRILEAVTPKVNDLYDDNEVQRRLTSALQSFNLPEPDQQTSRSSRRIAIEGELESLFFTYGDSQERASAFRDKIAIEIRTARTAEEKYNEDFVSLKKQWEDFLRERRASKVDVEDLLGATIAAARSRAAGCPPGELPL